MALIKIIFDHTAQIKVIAPGNEGWNRRFLETQ